MSTTAGPWPSDSQTAIAPFGVSSLKVFTDPDPGRCADRTLGRGRRRRKPIALPFRPRFVYCAAQSQRASAIASAGLAVALPSLKRPKDSAARPAPSGRRRQQSPFP